MQLIAGRTGQEFNQRKNRKGAFWDDRYHATAIEDGDHFLRCCAYIDLNMVRAGVVDHPSQWPHSGYNDIQRPRRKNVLIDSDKFMELLGTDNYDQFKRDYQGWVAEFLGNGNGRDDKWT
jgi:putative transposase